MFAPNPSILNTFEKEGKLRETKKVGSYKMNGINRLIAAALVDRNFCELLLTRPDEAVEMSYNNEDFYLTPNDKKIVVSIRAVSLADFASQIYGWLNTEA